MQIGRVDDRQLTRSMSAPLGAVRLTETFLTGDQRNPKDIAALRRARPGTVAELSTGSAATATSWASAGRCGPSPSCSSAPRGVRWAIQRIPDGRHALAETIDVADRTSCRPALPAARPPRRPGRHHPRGRAGRSTRWCARSGPTSSKCAGRGCAKACFSSTTSRPPDPRCSRTSAAVRSSTPPRASGTTPSTPSQIARVALMGFDATAAAGLHAGDPDERETAVGRRRCSTTSACWSVTRRTTAIPSTWSATPACPAFMHREIALIACMVRGHRKGIPSLDGYRTSSSPATTRCSPGAWRCCASPSNSSAPRPARSPTCAAA